MIRRSILSLLPLALLVAGCPQKKDKASSPNVNDDVWVSTGAGPTRLILEGNTGWVINGFSNSVDAVDLATCETTQGSCDLLGTVNLPVDSFPFDGAVASGRLHVVLTGFGFASVQSIDTTTRQVVATITTGAGALYSPQAVAVAGGRMFIADSNFYGSGPGFLAMVTGTAITGSTTTTQLQPGAFSLLPNGNLAVTNTGLVDFGDFGNPDDDVVTQPGGIDIVNPTTGAVVDNIDLGLVAPVGRLVVEGNSGYVVSATEGTLLKVDMTTGTFVEIEVTQSGSFLTWTEVVDGKLYVLASAEDIIYVLDATTGEELDTIIVGPGGDTAKEPSHIAVWEDGDGVTHLLVTMYAANSVSDVVLP